MNEDYAFAAGFDCGMNGENERNCHYTMFAVPEMTAAWLRGKMMAEAEKDAEADAQAHESRERERDIQSLRGGL